MGTAVRGSDWMPLRGVDPRRLSEARLQAHYAVQWLARFARGYVSPQPEDGHTNLGWDGALGFASQPAPEGTWLSLRVSDLTLVLHPGSGNDQDLSVSLAGRTDADVRRWLGERLGARGLDAGALDAPSPYAMPAHAVAQGAAYAPIGLADALSEFAAWFENAARSLGVLQRQLLAAGLTTSSVRCWPHHFDLASLTTLSARKSGISYVGCGFSPGDTHYDEPYFYISVYPPPGHAELPMLPPPGHWHTCEFVAAVLPAHKIIAATRRQADSEAFLHVGLNHALELAGGPMLHEA